MEGMGRRGKRRKLLLADLKEKRSLWNFGEEALDRTLYSTDFGRDCGTVARQTV